MWSFIGIFLVAVCGGGGIILLTHLIFPPKPGQNILGQPVPAPKTPEERDRKRYGDAVNSSSKDELRNLAFDRFVVAEYRYQSLRTLLNRSSSNAERDSLWRRALSREGVAAFPAALTLLKERHASATAHPAPNWVGAVLNDLIEERPGHADEIRKTLDLVFPEEVIAGAVSIVEPRPSDGGIAIANTGAVSVEVDKDT